MLHTFYIGDIVKHKGHEWYGVIVGYDEQYLIIDWFLEAEEKRRNFLGKTTNAIYLTKVS